MKFNALCREHGLDPATLTIMMHSGSSAKLRRLLPWIAAERPADLMTYSSYHSKPAERTLQGRRHSAVFVRVEGAGMVLAAVYEVIGWADRLLDDIDRDPKLRRIEEFYGEGNLASYHRSRGRPTIESLT